MKSIYLDNNSTTRISDAVVEEMVACYRLGLKNPASQHRSGREARIRLENARDEIGLLLGANLRAPGRDRVILTSGGTEANNLAIHGLVSGRGNVVISAIEHPSVLEPAKRLESLGCELRHLPVSPSGHVLLEKLSHFIDPQTLLVCVMLANNELGTIQPIREIANFCQSLRVPVHCDAVQAVGKMPVDFRSLGVATLAYSAHKFHGPRGAGGLLVRHDIPIQPLLVGGSQQLGVRAGTEAVALAVGSSTALKQMLDPDLGDWGDRVKPLRDHLENLLVSATNAHVVGSEPRMPHATNLAFPGVDRQALVMALDLVGVECSTGSACTSGSSEPSHVVIATGASDCLVQSSVRFSLSGESTRSEIDEAGRRILNVVSSLQHLD